MTSPIDPPEGDWWSQPVNRREAIWLGIAGAWSLFLFSWMSGWVRAGEQNPVGETVEVSTSEFRERVESFKSSTEAVDSGYTPPDEKVYIGGRRYNWEGLRIEGEPLVLETGREYEFHMGAYDVQHAVSMRPEHTLSKQINLDIMPGYEWVMPMTFEEPGEYHVICTEFCGNGHEGMHSSFIVEDEL